MGISCTLNNMQRTFFAINLPLVFLKERRTSIAYSPALDLSASGSTPQKAKENFQTTLRLFIEESIEHGTMMEEVRVGTRKAPWIA